MKNEKIKSDKVKIENKGKFYTLGEEIFNAVSHGVGALLSIAALVLLVVAAVIGKGSASAIVSAVIYGVSLIVLYTSSTLYHALTNETAKKVFRIFDHSSIFILIAGTYTPIALVILKDTNLGIILFSVLWTLTVLGIILNSLSIEKFKVISMLLYVGMGWAAVLAAKPLWENVVLPGIILLVIGGIAYTGGLTFYGLKKFKYMHSIWHLFVLAGSVLHFLCIILFVYN